jgi:ABC-2 type transport system ATP-binding protein
MMAEENLYPDGMRVQRAFNTAATFHPDFDMEYAQELSNSLVSICAKDNLSFHWLLIDIQADYGNVRQCSLFTAGRTGTGLDAQHRDMFYKILLEKYAKSPCTIIISTHLIQEAAALIEHAVIIREGRILRDMPTEEMLSGAYNVSGPAGLVDTFISGNVCCPKAPLAAEDRLHRGPGGDVTEGLELNRVQLQDYFISLMNEEDGR